MSVLKFEEIGWLRVSFDGEVLLLSHGSSKFDLRGVTFSFISGHRLPLV